MNDIANPVGSLVIGFSFILAYRLLAAYRIHKAPYILYFLIYWALSIVYMTLMKALTLFPGTFNETTRETLSGAFAILPFFQLFYFFLTVKQLKNIRQAPVLRSISMVFGTLALLFFLDLIFADISDKPALLFNYVLRLLHISIAALLFMSPNPETVSRHYALKMFGALYISFSGLMLITFVLGDSGLVAMPPLHAIYFVSKLAVIILTLLYLKPFLALFDCSVAKTWDELLVDYAISKREKDVIELICKGKTNKEIADSLFISIATVKDHIYNIFKKTGVRNRVQLSNLFNPEAPGHSITD